MLGQSTRLCLTLENYSTFLRGRAGQSVKIIPGDNICYVHIMDCWRHPMKMIFKSGPEQHSAQDHIF